jgi:hypothetical protein
VWPNLSLLVSSGCISDSIVFFRLDWYAVLGYRTVHSADPLYAHLTLQKTPYKYSGSRPACLYRCCVHDVSGGTHATTRTSRCVASRRFSDDACLQPAYSDRDYGYGRHSAGTHATALACTHGGRGGSRTCHVAPLTRRGRRAVAVRDSARL